VSWLVGTRNGIVGQGGETWLPDREITALAPGTDGWWVLAAGRDVIRIRGEEVETIASIEEEAGRCLLAVDGGALVGTANARLVMARAGLAEFLAPFDDAEGRDGWYTPWGGPPDTRSLAAGPDGAVFANVHVGGILRAADPLGVWEPTIDVDADVHQVVADPDTVGHVVAATALGLAESSDAGRTWHYSTQGLHAPYARAVALDGDVLFLSASTGPRGGRAAVYRREPGGDSFGKCEGGLPEWFGQNIDSHRLAAAGGSVVFGTEEGEVFLSEDGGVSWERAAEGLEPVTSVAIEVPARTAT
jgi:hypothetical protein